MSLPTVESLCRALGQHLQPVAGFDAPVTPVTAVHISELLDPSAYVTGGEILLTTGLMLPANKIGCERYVARLAEIEIVALGLGLGPVHKTVPSRLIEACEKIGLPLLVVPISTPFLTITKAYWAARARSTEQSLQDAVATHRALIDAAVAPDPGAEILRRLSRALDGWAASVTSTGEVDQIYPAGLIDEAEALQAEVARLEVAGVHSAASFTTRDRYVAIYPLSVEGRVVGYLAVGTPAQFTGGAAECGAHGGGTVEHRRDAAAARCIGYGGHRSERRRAPGSRPGRRS
ncbi:MAG TPA: PucR family transcriptional regulator ligand-binding domain-containing protein [Nocardioides sp.]|uniref:PucR family transcriptional regulator ligand-binding domain-containing protein n=1 Tax=uncultured Nocardioides sp. TaxID=198441 RepID=UPI002603FBC4|nr:PucR family transcriptional regulator ligand-binding domain-containing protein [uncultured Nocardioides sp.]HRI94832.1 PucR family transcriptional regulator ligand-binding domain-containing protein [Nocardioides sp.]HRK44903.1 PucR family transcriptional regulator ligand-binding domain-containing protein [Nocardioides sp.]